MGWRGVVTMTRRIRDAQALFRCAMVARFISLPLGVAKITAVGKEIAPNIYQGEFDTSCLESTVLCKPNKLTKLSGHIRTNIWYCSE